MPFLAHLEELRKRLIICFSAIGLAFVLAFNIREYCIRLLQWPLATDIVMGEGFPSSFSTTSRHRKADGARSGRDLVDPFQSGVHRRRDAGAARHPSPDLEIHRAGPLGEREALRHAFVILSTISFFVGVTFCFLIVLPMRCSSC